MERVCIIRAIIYGKEGRLAAQSHKAAWLHCSIFTIDIGVFKDMFRSQEEDMKRNIA